MTREEAIKYLKEKSFQDYSGTAYEIAIEDMEKQKMIEDYAQNYAKSLVMYGVDISEKHDTAVSMSLALENAYLRGRADGLKYACENIGKWIPCSERYPEYNKVVLTTIGSFYDVRELCEGDEDEEDEEDYWEDNAGFFHDYDTVIAWMPLPEPYKGE